MEEHLKRSREDLRVRETVEVSKRLGGKTLLHAVYVRHTPGNL